MTVALSVMSPSDARRLTEKIKASVEDTWHLIKEAYTTRAWDVLGYQSWDDYCAREFGTSRLRLPREERQDVIASLRESGLSLRAIAAATGDSEATVRNDLAGAQNCAPGKVTGTDGKTYSPTAKVTETTKTEYEVNTQTGEVIDPPSPPRSRSRKPLPEQARQLGWDLRKVIERLDRIAADDRFNTNQEQMATHLRGHLTHAIEVCQDVLARVTVQEGA